jgi:hypothetical protein
VVNVKFASGNQMTVDQLGFIDSKAGHAYILAIACPPACYAANHATIDRVLASWVLKGHT